MSLSRIIIATVPEMGTTIAHATLEDQTEDVLTVALIVVVHVHREILEMIEQRWIVQQEAQDRDAVASQVSFIFKTFMFSS